MAESHPSLHGHFKQRSSGGGPILAFMLTPPRHPVCFCPSWPRPGWFACWLSRPRPAPGAMAAIGMINKLAASYPARRCAGLSALAGGHRRDRVPGPGAGPLALARRAGVGAAQAPEHFIDLEPADALGPLPHRRLDFEARVFASGQRPEKIGLQPWEATEVWERLKAAMREYRKLAAGHEDTRPVEQAISFMRAGWATMWATARSRCTPPSNTTAGWGRIPTATPPATRFTGSSRGRLWTPTCASPRCGPR